MKKMLLVFYACLYLSAARSQDIRRTTISIGAGLGVPIGEFASTKYGSMATGFAKPGVALDFGVKHNFKSSHFGIATQLRNISFPYDEGRANNYLYSSGASSMTRNNYRTISLYAGPSYNLLNHKHFVLGFKMLAGLMNIGSTDQIWKTQIGINPESDFKMASKTTVSYLLGLNFDYKLNERIVITSMFDFQRAKPHLHTTFNNPSSNSPYTYDQNISALSACVGLGYRL
jgi:hypothetical protein